MWFYKGRDKQLKWVGPGSLESKATKPWETPTEEGTKPPAEAWNILELSFEVKFYLEERSKGRQVLTGSVDTNLGWGSQASWLREESAKGLPTLFSLLPNKGPCLASTRAWDLEKTVRYVQPYLPELFRLFTGLIWHWLISATPI